MVNRGCRTSIFSLENNRQRILSSLVCVLRTPIQSLQYVLLAVRDKKNLRGENRHVHRRPIHIEALASEVCG